MLNYYLGNQPIQGPLQSDGLTLKKSRNRKYWGFLYRKLGFVEGTGNLRFEEPDVLTVMENAVDRWGVDAQTSFRIEQNGEILYDGFLDYATYTPDSEGVSIGLRDNKAVVDLSAQATTMYSLSPDTAVSLHARRLGTLPGLVTDPRGLIIQRSESSAVAITHAVPFTRRSETDDTIYGSLAPVVVPLLSDPCYRNTSDKTQTVRLQGLVSVTASSTTSMSATLRAIASNDPYNPVTVGTVSISSTPGLKQLAVDVSLSVTPNDSLKLEWVGTNNTTKFVFAYDDKTGITVTDEKRYTDTVNSSLAYSTLVIDAFKSLVTKASNNKLSFRSAWLTTGDGKGLMLCNGYGVRGINKPISVSLDTLFLGLNSIRNLAMWVDGDTVRLEPKSRVSYSNTFVESITSRSAPIATEYLYNSVKAGYSTWTTDVSNLSNDEPNGLRVYSTGVTAVRNELNLVSDLITSSTVIESHRRKQFDAKTASSDKSDTLDDKLFIICSVPTSTGYKAETGEKTSFITGNYDTSTLYNVRLTPGRMLYNWLIWLGASLPLTSEQVMGKDTIRSICNDIAITESSPLPDTASRTPRLVTITAPLSMIQYENLQDIISYEYRGKTYFGELLDADWKLMKTGETGTLTLLER